MSVRRNMLMFCYTNTVTNSMCVTLNKNTVLFGIVFSVPGPSVCEPSFDSKLCYCCDTLKQSTNDAFFCTVVLVIG